MENGMEEKDTTKYIDQPVSSDIIFDGMYGTASEDTKSLPTNMAVKDVSVEPSAGSFCPKKWPEFCATFVATLGSFALGNVIGWTSPALPSLSDSKDLGEISQEQKSWIASLAILGALISGLPTGYLINIIGRRGTLQVTPILLLLGWLLMAFAQVAPMMYIGRFITGACGGSFTVTVPVYISETVEETRRGLLSSMMVLMLVTGILFAFVFGALCSWFWLTLASCSIPLIMAALVQYIPETPHYLLTKDRDTEAKSSLLRLRGAENFDDVEQEYLRVRSTVEYKQDEATNCKALLEPHSYKPTIICFILMVFQQLGGINGITMYTVDIFTAAGSDVNPNMASIIIGIVQVLFVFLSMMLVDKLGRKYILVVSDIVMFFSLTVFGIFFYLKEQGKNEMVENLHWLPLVCLISFIIAYSAGAGPIPWIFLAELIPPHVKGIASSLVTSTYWVLAFTSTKTFPDMTAHLGDSGCYWLFAVICLGGAVFTLIVVPETKGKTLEEIQSYFGKQIDPIEQAQYSDLVKKYPDDFKLLPLVSTEKEVV